jgi:hypothetical protein
LKFKTDKAEFRNHEFPLYSKLLDLSLSLELINEKQIVIEVELSESDLSKLYKIFLVLAFILGKEITLRYYYENFPYYPVPGEYNFGRYRFDFAIRKYFLLEPIKFVETGYSLIQQEDSYFNRIVPVLLEVNAIPSAFVRFFSEFALLESLVKGIKADSFLFPEGSKEYLSLENFEEKSIKLLKADPVFGSSDKVDSIERKLAVKKLNSKGSTVDKIRLFLEKENLQRYCDYPGRWNILRNNKGIGHGAIFSDRNIEVTREEKNVMKELHELLAELVMSEFKSLLEKES